MTDAYKIPMIERIIAAFPQCATPFGTSGSSQRINPYVPIFSMIPERSIVPCVGATTYVSGCHVWKGNTGILIAKAMNIAQKIQVCSEEERFFPASYKARISNECV